MGDFIKSAFNFISNSSGLKSGSEYVGTQFEISGRQVNIKRLLAKGGFSLIYEATECATQRPCALKRIISTSMDHQKSILQEIQFMKQLNNHPNILQFLYAAKIKPPNQSDSPNHEFLIVTEICLNGDLSNYMPTPHSNMLLPMENILKVFYQTCSAVEYLHTQPEPIIHRDLKIENLLISDKLMIKVCDFGSATNDRYSPDTGWTLNRRKTLQDSIELVTTPMYRPPEIIDLFLNYPICEKMDIWALGCILFYLTANFHPFEDSAKLAILNAKYQIPDLHKTNHHILESLISTMLLLDPTSRPSIQEVLSNVSEIAKMQKILPAEPAVSIKRKSFINNSRPVNPMTDNTPPVVSDERSTRPKSDHDDPLRKNEVFEMFKNGAKDIFKNVKNLTKNAEHFSDFTNVKTPKLAMITSRIGVTEFPLDERKYFASANALNEKFPSGNYRIFNLTTKPYFSADTYDGNFYNCSLDNGKTLSFNKLIQICMKAELWLSKAPGNVCIFQCDDGNSSSCLVISSILCYFGVFSDKFQAIQYFCSKVANPHLTSSQRRYIGYACKLREAIGNPTATPIPHNYTVHFKSLVIRPVPIFNKQKNGCRPYFEVYQGNEIVYTNFLNYQQLREYTQDQGSINFELRDVFFGNDITVILYHARSGQQDSFSPDKRVPSSSIKICEFTIAPYLIDPNTKTMTLSKYELDGLSESNQMIGFTKRYPDNLRVELTINILKKEYPRFDTLIYPWEFHDTLSKDSKGLAFETTDELDAIINDFKHFTEEDYLKSSQDNPPSDAKRKSEHVSKDSVYEAKEELNEETSHQTPDPPLFQTPHQEKPQTAPDTSDDLFDVFSTSKSQNGRSRADSNRDEPKVNSSQNNPFFNLNDDFDSFQSAKSTNIHDDLHDIFNTNPSNGQSNSHHRHEQKNDYFTKPTEPDPFSPNGTPFDNNGPTSHTSSSQNANSQKQSKSSDFFEDLLGDFKSSEKYESPKTVNELLKEKSRASLDPENKKVLNWSEGKQKNIRSLLCTLPNILWEGVRWRPITINDLLTTDQVKKCYRNAARCVHPDKWNNTEHEYIAKLVFMELSEAMVQFEKTAL